MYMLHINFLIKILKVIYRAVKDHRPLYVFCSEISFKVVEIGIQRGMKRLTLHKKCPYSEFLWSECGKIRIRKTTNTDTFYAVYFFVIMFEFINISVYLPENWKRYIYCHDNNWLKSFSIRSIRTSWVIISLLYPLIIVFFKGYKNGTLDKQKIVLPHILFFIDKAGNVGQIVIW